MNFYIYLKGTMVKRSETLGYGAEDCEFEFRLGSTHDWKTLSTEQ